MANPARPLTGGSRDVRREAYQEVADRLGGELVEGRMTGGVAVRVEHDGRMLTLGLHPVQTGTVTLLHTRVLVLFQGRDELRLSVRPRGFVDRVAARLGFGGLHVAGRRFAEHFVVRGRPKARVRSVMSAGLAAAIGAESGMRVAIGSASWRQRRRLGAETRRLEVLVARSDPDVERMVAMFGVAREGIDALVRIGVAAAKRSGRGRAD